MRAPEKVIPLDTLRHLVSYEPLSGALVWASDGRHRRVGREIGNVQASSGYRVVTLCGSTFKAHRIAWALANGEWPSGPIDHINGDKLDNRLVNLRLADALMNSQNQRRAMRRNGVGLLGVTRCRNGRYRAKLRADGVYVHVGIFDTPDLAHAAYVVAKRRLHCGCTI